MENIEEVFLDITDFEIVEKLFRARKSPSICVGKTSCYVNITGAPFIPKFFKWYVNEEWCCLKKCDEEEKNAYKARTITAGKSFYTLIRLPSALEGAVTFRGLHKLYKTKDGVAFKKYEED